MATQKKHFLTATLIICLIIAQLKIEQVNSANILCLMGIASPSHHIWNKSIMKALANRGHNLTILSVEEKEISEKNMNYIKIEKIYQLITEFFLEEGEKITDSDAKIDLSRRSPFYTTMEIYQFSTILDKHVLKSDGVKQLLNYPKTFKFDLVIHDFTGTQVLLGFVHRFGHPPLVSVSAYNIPPFANAVSGVVNFPSYMPYLGVDLSNQMTYMERVYNLLYWAFDGFYREFIFMPEETHEARQFFGSNMPSIQSIESNSDLVLVNIDWSIDYPQLLPPNVIPVGGLQVKRVEPLEGELAEFMSSSKNGVVLFSLGTNVKSSYLGSTVYTILEAFRQLKEYDFIWKFETDELTNIPENVLIREFLPQNSILAHPKIKLFMTHGGLLSMQESIWYGVPMLGFPIFADQYQNMLKVKQGGLGIELNIQNLTVPLLMENIRNIIDDPSYKDTALLKSQLFRNQPMHPLDRAIFWIEHVLENNGAEHLKLGNSHLNTIQLYLLDIYGILLFILISFILIFVKNCCFGRRRSTGTNDNNKKND